MKVAVYLHIKEVPLPAQDARLMAKVEALAPEIEWIDCADEDAFLARLPECEVAATWYFRPQWAARTGKLRLLATPAAGREFIDAGAAPAFEIVHGTFQGRLMAETVAGLMLAFARGIKAAIDARQGADPWPRAEITRGMRTLRGSRAVILGFGHIGKWIGRVLKQFGVRITGVNRADMSLPDYFSAGDGVAPLSALDSRLAACDHLILSLPGGAGTDGLVDARRLALLPDGAYVYNVGRGNSLDGDALARELLSGRLGGAGLDVYRPEPLPADAALRRCPNAILMPHVSAMAPDYLDLFFDELLIRLRG